MRLPFTADTCAHAAIAAARALGDDPVRAMTTPRGVLRRSLGPAAWAVHLVTITPLENTARAFGVNVENVRRAASERGASWVQALDAARTCLLTLPPPPPAPRAPRPTPPVVPAVKPVPARPPSVAPPARQVAAIVVVDKPDRPRRIVSRAPAPKEPARVTADERALIDAAVAAGKVTVVPAGTAAGLSALETLLYAAPPPMGEGGWKVAHQQKKAADMARRKREARDDEAA